MYTKWTQFALSPAGILKKSCLHVNRMLNVSCFFSSKSAATNTIHDEKNCAAIMKNKHRQHTVDKVGHGNIFHNSGPQLFKK